MAAKAAAAKASGGAKLVIVESPTKAKTIRKFLGKGYRVEASMGHVRDLPANAAEIPKEVKDKEWARIGVDIENGYTPVYIVPPEKKKVVTELKRALEEADELYLATDEDREGESIGWHLVQVLKPKIPTRRMVFHEITEDAIQKALAKPRDIDEHLVQAQETRRVLDRLVGYTVSPLLWKKVAPKLSAGRVQSVAVRLLVLRERERMAFVAGTYWDLTAMLEKAGASFTGQLLSLGGTRLATGKDFDEATGKVAPDKNVLLLSERQARELEQALGGKPFRVASIETRAQTRSPYPPFTTSTLQQEANRKLGLSARRTMQVAQRLYENGFITYMRTDSVNLSEEAINAARSLVERKYGREYLSDEVRQYTNKSKGAQEAHEAIRPAGAKMPTAEELQLDGPEARLYEMIWKRTVATQMAEAKLSFTTVKLEVDTPRTGALPGGVAEFRATGKEIVFPGFFRAYVEGSDDPDEALEDRSQPLPKLTEGERVECKGIEALGHETKPPARYTEATLVKALEKEGIGRPSTYASIIDTIQQRGYVQAKNKQLIPTFTGMAVTRLLEEALHQVVDLQFTAAMEERLDGIAEGKSALEYLDAFYKKELLNGVAGGAELDAREMCTIVSPKIAPYLIRVGRYGPYVEYSEAKGEEKAKTVSLPEDMAPADVDKVYIEELIAKAKLGNKVLGVFPETGENIYLMHGRFGHYIQVGEFVDGGKKPKRTGIPPNLNPLQIDEGVSMQLLALPRTVGEHPETSKIVKAGIGMYGPYVLYDKTYASLKPEDDVLTVSLERALQLIAEKKARFGGNQDALKELGEHPEDKKTVRIMNGRYGPYIKWNKVNASLPEGVSPDEVTMERAVELLAERAAKMGGKRRGGRGAAKAAASEGATEAKRTAPKKKAGGKAAKAPKS